MYGGLKNLSRYLLAGAGAIGILTGSGLSVAKAATLEELQAQLSELQRQVNEAKAAAAAAQAAAANAGGGDLDMKIKWKGAPQITSGDGKKFSFKVRGRLMADYNGIDQDFPVTGEGDISAVELRRARIGVEGVIFYDWIYKFEVDFAGDSSEIKDAYIAWAHWMPSWDKSEIRVGNQKTYNSLEQITSSRFITFMERAAYTEAFFMDRQIGGALVAGNDHWSFQTGFYGATPGGQENFDSDQTAYTVRGTVAPINRDVNGVNQVLHLGASYRHRNAGTLNECGKSRCDSETALYEYRARGADLHLADRFVDTPNFSNEDDLFNLEAAFVWGPFSVQGEYAQLEANGVTPFNDPTLAPVNPTYDGWYVEASVFLTGDTRDYKAATGEFGRTKVKNPVWGGSGGWGAIQIAGRYDVLNLSDKGVAMMDAYGCSECGDQETWLVAVNWLLTDYTALKFNVTQSEITGGNASGSNKNDGAEITGFGTRFQIDW